MGKLEKRQKEKLDKWHEETMALIQKELNRIYKIVKVDDSVLYLDGGFCIGEAGWDKTVTEIDFDLDTLYVDGDQKGVSELTSQELLDVLENLEDIKSKDDIDMTRYEN